MSGVLVQDRDGSTVEVQHAARGLVASVSNLMSSANGFNENSTSSELENGTTTEAPTSAEASTNERSITMSTLAVLSSVRSAVMASEVAGEEPVVMETESVHIQLKKARPLEMLRPPNRTQSRGPGDEVTVTNSVYTPVSFWLPENMEILDGIEEIGSEVTQFRQDPYTWSGSSEKSSTPTVEIVLTGSSFDSSHLLNQPINILLPVNRTNSKRSEMLLPVKLAGYAEMTLTNDHSGILSLMSGSIYNDTNSTDVSGVDYGEGEVIVKLFYLEKDTEGHVVSRRDVQETEDNPEDMESTESVDLSLADNVTQKGVLVFEEIFPLSELTGSLEDNPLSLQTVPLELQGPGDYVLKVYTANTSLSLNVSMETAETSCLRWDEFNEMWTREGCALGRSTNAREVHCECDRPGTFAGGLFILPNKLNFREDLAMFLEFWKNPVGVAFVSFVFVVYVLAVLWARRRDQMYRLKSLPIDLLDNAPDQHLYILTVCTGTRRGAGTTSQVTVTLYGELGDSGPHVLECSAFPILGRGDISFFIIRTQSSLGKLTAIRYWHHSTGPSPAWFVSRSSVYDSEAREEYHFLCNCWLAVDVGECVLDRTFPVATQDEISDFQNLFLTNAASGFNDRHLWFSALRRHAHSAFTCVQRVSCCLALFMSYMLNNIMFYGIVSAPEEQAMDFGPFSVTWTEIRLGFQTTLLMFPLNYLIVVLFRDAPSRHPVTEVWRSDAWRQHQGSEDTKAAEDPEPACSLQESTASDERASTANTKVVTSSQFSFVTCSETDTEPRASRTSLAEEEPSAVSPSFIGQLFGQGTYWDQRHQDSDLILASSKAVGSLGVSQHEGNIGVEKIPLQSLHQEQEQNRTESQNSGSKSATNSKGSSGSEDGKMDRNININQNSNMSQVNVNQSNNGPAEASVAGEGTGVENENPPGVDNSEALSKEDTKTVTATVTMVSFNKNRPRNPRITPGRQNVMWETLPTICIKSPNEDKEAFFGELPKNSSLDRNVSSSEVPSKDEVLEDISQDSTPVVDPAYNVQSKAKSTIDQSTEQSKTTSSPPSITTPEQRRPTPPGNKRASTSRSYLSLTMESSSETSTESGSTSSRRSSRRPRCRGCRQPWWTVYIAWALVTMVTLTCAFFTILYTFNYGVALSLQWVKSILVSWVSDLLISQPTKVLGLAVFFSLVYKTPEQLKHIDTDGLVAKEAIPKGVSSESLLRDLQLRLRQDPSYRPPAQSEVYRGRETRDTERRMWAVATEILRYLAFLYLVLLIAYVQRDTSLYWQNKSLLDILVTADGGFEEIDSMEGVWEWLEETVVDGVYDDVYTKYLSNGVSVRIGSPRLRQLRISKESPLPCHWRYSLESEERRDYNGSWDGDGSAGPEYRDVWRYKSEEEVGGVTTAGQFGEYSGGGYMCELGFSKADARRALSYLHQAGWLDSNTAAVLVDLSTYSPNVNHLTAATFLIELGPVGGVWKTVNLYSMPMYRRLGTVYYFVIAIEVVYCMHTLYFCVYEIRRINRYRWKYLENLWNFIEVGTLVIALSIIGLVIAHEVEISNALSSFDPKQNRLGVFKRTRALDQALTFCFGSLVMLGMFKFLHLLRFNPLIHKFGRTLSKLAAPLGGYSGFFFVFLFSFASLLYLLTGTQVEVFSSMMAAQTTLLLTILGEYPGPELEEYDVFWGPMLFTVYYCLLLFLFFNLFLKLIFEALEEVKQQPQPAEDAELLWLLLDKFSQWLGLRASTQPVTVSQRQHSELGAQKPA